MRTSTAALIGATALLLAGCTQQARPGAQNQPGPSTAGSSASSTSPSGGVSSPAPVSSPAASSSSAAGSPAASSTAASTPGPSATSQHPVPAIEPGGCPTAALSVRAIRGSGAAGHEFAFLQFTNVSTKSCSLTGYPGVQLQLAGKPLGQPAVRSGKPVRTVQISPGTSVSANLVDDSSCNAPVSDTVQVYPPNRTDRLVLKLALRGCQLHVDPVSAS